MKKTILFTFFIFMLNQNCSNDVERIEIIDNISFFDNSNFVLEYILVHGVKEELLLEENAGIIPFSLPFLRFKPSNTENKLEAEMGVFCNGGVALYTYGDLFLKITDGARTLVQCGNSLSQESRIFNILQVDFDPSKEVYYEITPNQKGLWIWVDENEKLFFNKEI